MILGEHWYASGTLWSAAGIAVAIVASVATAWVTWRVGYPRRRLSYQLRAATRLLNPDARDMVGDLEVRRSGTVLCDPKVATVELANQGRIDIPSSCFDSGLAMRLELGVEIVDVLSVSSDPATARGPAVSADGTALRVGPGLIKAGQRVTVAVLLDGGEPAVTCPERPLIDVEIRDQADLDARAARWRAMAAAAIVAAGVACFAQCVARPQGSTFTVGGAASGPVASPTATPAAAALVPLCSAATVTTDTHIDRVVGGVAYGHVDASALASCVAVGPPVLVVADAAGDVWSNVQISNADTCAAPSLAAVPTLGTALVLDKGQTYQFQLASVPSGCARGSGSTPVAYRAGDALAGITPGGTVTVQASRGAQLYAIDLHKPGDHRRSTV